jgi:tripartite-type tricarboxylate transporter receptor subunit TctC
VRKLLGALIGCCGLCTVDASAQTYPVKPVRVILGTAAGGTGDISARILSYSRDSSICSPRQCLPTIS